MDFNDPKEFDDPQVLDDLKEILIGSMDFDHPKVYGDTSISDGLVFQGITTFDMTRSLNLFCTFFAVSIDIVKVQERRLVVDLFPLSVTCVLLFGFTQRLAKLQIFLHRTQTQRRTTMHFFLQLTR